MKTNKTAIFIGILGILILILCLQQCNISHLKTDLAMKDVNIHALNDTIKLTKNKLGQSEYTKSVLITSNKGLADLNEDLKTEVDAQKGKVAYLQKIIANISTHHDSPIVVRPPQSAIPKNPCDTTVTYTLPWTADKTFDLNNYRKLNGKTSVTVSKGIFTQSEIKIDNDEIGFDIITGLEKKNGHYEIFIRSNYPGFKPTKIDGAFIPQNDLFPPQKKKSWSVGPTFSTGVGFGGINPQKLSPVIYIGVGLGFTYKWINF